MYAVIDKLIKNDTHIYSDDQDIIFQGMAPIVARRTKSTTLSKADLFEQVKFQNWQTKAGQLFQQLAENNIKFLVFKGFAYSYLHYAKSHIRPYADIDILIQQSDYIEVENILQNLGYRCYPSRQGQFVSFQNSFFDEHRPQTVFDLHWQINNRLEFHKHFPFAQLWHEAQLIKTATIEFKTLSMMHGLVLACFHYQAHREADRKHIWLYDIAIMWTQMSSSQQQQCLLFAQSIQQSKIVNTTLILLQKTFNNCIDINNISHNNQHENTETYLKKRPKKVVDIHNRLKNIHGLRNKTKFIAEYLFQSKAYMQNRYKLSSRKWIYLYYPKMWLQDILKLFK
ncbi:MAG TPA: hypothetical protein ENJ41_06600 [Oceanospirillales bacterium]|nr:hypothetical protein [Oceanospirillales bacterium]